MKIVYNNRKNRTNWGARSTGKALYQILTKEHEVIYDFDRPVMFLPSKLESFIIKKIKNNQIKFLVSFFFKVLYKIVPFFNRKQLIFPSVEKSANAILSNYKRDKELTDIIQGIKDCDALIINGEGSMILSQPVRYELFFYFALIRIAKSFNKKTFYVNAMASGSPAFGFDKVLFDDIKKNLKYCDLFMARDYETYELLKNHEGLNINVCPDSLFTWQKYFEAGLSLPKLSDEILPFPEQAEDFGKFNFQEDYICVGGSSFLYQKGNNTSDMIIDRYEKLVNSLKQLNKKIYLVETCVTDVFLKEVAKRTETLLIPNNISLLHAIAILGNAKILISGRYHPSIMASLNGTPCVFFNSNSHKTKSLQFLLDYENIKEYSSELSDDEIKQIIEECNSILSKGSLLREKIYNQVQKLAKQANSIDELITKA